MLRLIILLLVLIPLALHAQRDWDAVAVKVNPVTDKISFLTGAGGNIGVIHGEDGLMIIDDQYAELSTKIMDTLSALSETELRFVINTHFHGDHTGGNANFRSYGATVVAHENVRSRLGKSFFNQVFEREVAAKPEDFWPTVTFSNDLTFHFNDEEIQIIHSPSAHTDGDALVYFKTSNVLHAGDCFVRYGYPFIDIAAGGTIDGMITAQKQILQIIDKDTKIIPGHGALATRSDVEELLTMLESSKEIIANAKRNGEKLEDLIAKKPLADFHDRWNGRFINSDLFVLLVFESL